MTPEQRMHQRVQALGHANRVRLYRSQVRHDLKAARCTPREVLTSDHPMVQGMTIGEVVGSVPGFGKDRRKGMLRDAHISADRPICQLTLRQRTAMIEELEAFCERSVLWRRALDAQAVAA